MIDVVIVNWNAGLQLKNCVDSLLQYSGQVLSNIIVVDNGSTDDSVAELPADERLIVIRLNTNQGFASGCNAGAQVATAEYILFLNPDAAVYADTLSTVHAFMQADAQQNIGVLGVKLLDEQGHVARSCSRFPTAARCLAQSAGLDKVQPFFGPAMAEWDHLDSRFVDQVIGAFFLVRRALFVQLQGFDERFFVYYEEVDFAYRAAQAGYRSYYLADTSAFHLGGGVSNQVKAKRLFYTLRSRVLFASKHFAKPAALLVLLSVMSVEPLMRFAQAAIRLSAAGLHETFAGFSLFYQWLPAWWFRGETRN